MGRAFVSAVQFAFEQLRERGERAGDLVHLGRVGRLATWADCSSLRPDEADGPNLPLASLMQEDNEVSPGDAAFETGDDADELHLMLGWVVRDADAERVLSLPTSPDTYPGVDCALTVERVGVVALYAVGKGRANFLQGFPQRELELCKNSNIRQGLILSENFTDTAR